MKSYFLFALILIFVILGCKTNKITTKHYDECTQQNIVSTKLEFQKTIISGDKSTISGQTKDAETGEYLPFVNIVLTDKQNKNFAVQSDFNGYFSINNLSNGNYTIKISYVGFNQIESTIDVEKMTKYTTEILLRPAPALLEKPIIYLYPTQIQNINVKLHYAGKLTYTYPNYTSNGWEVVAEPNGRLTDKNGKEYYALFWEGIPDKALQPKDGFIVSGKETLAFLEEKLAYLGLNRREINEFIIHWLPRMQNNPYNLIHFSGEEYEQIAKLNISPQPEIIIRVMMITKPLNSKIDFPVQDLTPLKKTRKGYTVVEWGGSVMNNIIK